MKRITIEEGPLAGNAYDVPVDTTVLDIRVKGGRYTVGPKHAPWHPDEEPVKEKARPSRKPKPVTAETTPAAPSDDDIVQAPRPVVSVDHPGLTAPTADTPE